MRLSPEERTILIGSAALLFLEHNVCFRETDPLSGRSYLVFPELINLKKPPSDRGDANRKTAWTTLVSGGVENVYASSGGPPGLYQHLHANQSVENQARYEVGDGLACGFRQEAVRDGELDFVLSLQQDAWAPPQRTLFQGLFECFLARHNLTVTRFEPVTCARGHPLDRGVVRKWVRAGKRKAFCNDCAEEVELPKAAEPIQLKLEEQLLVDAQRRTAEKRSRLEQAVFWVQTYVKDQKIMVPECFISYAWGVPEHERWVERNPWPRTCKRRA